MGCCSSSQRSCSWLSGSSRMGILTLQRQAIQPKMPGTQLGDLDNLQLQRSCCTGRACQGSHLYVSVCFKAARPPQSQLPCNFSYCPCGSSAQLITAPKHVVATHHAAHLVTVLVHSAAHVSPAQLIFRPAHCGRTIVSSDWQTCTCTVEPVAPLSGLYKATKHFGG